MHLLDQPPTAPEFESTLRCGWTAIYEPTRIHRKSNHYISTRREKCLQNINCTVAYTAVSSKVVPQKCKSVRDNADWFNLWVVRVGLAWLSFKVIQQQGRRKHEYTCLCCFLPPRWNTLSCVWRLRDSRENKKLSSNVTRPCKYELGEKRTRPVCTNRAS